MTGRNVGDGGDDGEPRGDTRTLQMMRDLIAHHVGLFKHFRREGIAVVHGGLVDDDRERRLDGMREVADMGARALDNLAVGVDQRIGLARERRDLDRKFAFEPFGVAGADSCERIRNALQRRETETHLEDRGQQQPDRQRGERAAEVVVEGAGLVENLGGIACHRDAKFAVRAEIDRPLHHAQRLVFRAVDIADTHARRRQLDALIFQLRKLLVPQRARCADFRLVGIGANDLPVPARQRQIEQRLAERLN